MQAAAWMRASVQVRDGLVEQVTRRYELAGGQRGFTHTAPVRAVVAARRIVRGERIAVIPGQSILTGQRATHVLKAVCLASSNSESALSYSKMVEAISKLEGSSPHLMDSRDAALLALALYFLRSPHHSSRLATLSVSSHMQSLVTWAAALPPRMPPLGLLMHQHYGGAGKFEPLQRVLKLNDVARPLLPEDSARDVATELMVAAMEEGGLEAVKAPRVEVALSEDMLTNFYKGNRSALTPRQFELCQAQAARYGTHAAVQQLARLERDLDTHVLEPLLRVVDAAPAMGSSSLPPLPLSAAVEDRVETAEKMEVLRWAHFMIRSRAVNLRWRERGSGPQVAVVPLLDMLNHSYTGANVVYHYHQSHEGEGGAVTVTASRAIQPGEELVLHYGSLGQRGCLFGDAPAPPSSLSPSSRHGGRRGAHTSSRGANRNVAEELKAIERRQMREMDEDTDAQQQQRAADREGFCTSMSGTQGPSLTSSAASSSRDSVGSSRQLTEAEEEARREVSWLWRYGFFRGKEECAHEASKEWSSALRERIAHLTDVRRNGRPGEFVVGVPEGLAQLRDQREALERERYNNARIFPPQRT